MTFLRTVKTRVLETAFFRPTWHSIFINPYFIARYSLYAAVRAYARTVPSTARILDIGCGIKPYRSLFTSSTYTGIDIEGGGHEDDAKTVDAYYDGNVIPFPDASFDTILCTQVLEHASDPEAVVREAARVVVPGGTVFFSMPFVYPEHEVPYDFRRFTRYEHERLFAVAGFSDIRIQATTGFFSTFVQLFTIMCFEGIRFRATLLKALLTFFVFAPVQALALLLDWIFRKPAPTLDYVITARKV